MGSLARFDENGKQVTMEGEKSLQNRMEITDEDVYWMHTRWIGTDENGQLEMSLPDGIYRIVSVSGMDVWYNPETEFMVDSGELMDINGSTIDTLIITKPGPNIVITVKNSGSTDSRLIEIKDMQNNRVFSLVSSTKIQLVTLYLEKIKAGKHKLVGFFSNGQWRN